MKSNMLLGITLASSMLVISGCGGSSLLDFLPTSTTPIGKFRSAGGNAIHAVQNTIDQNTIDPMSAVSTTVRVEGTIAYLDLPTCNYSVDIANYDATNANEWAGYPITIEYDSSIINCDPINCRLDSVELVGTVAEAVFSCN